jgi:RHS repeat-associated protein
MEYSWDYDDRPVNTAALRSNNLLTEVRRKSDGQILVRYSYDPLGRRIGKTAAGVTTIYIYDEQRVILEYQNGTPLRSYVYGQALDEIVSMENAAFNRYYFHSDTQNSVLALSDAAGIVTERYAYDAYGLTSFFDSAGNVIPQSAVGNSYLFTGCQYDEETGLYYYRTRYLHPQRGRFISRDTLGIWGDLAGLGNGYAYVGNNPVNHVDPFGLQEGVDFSGRKGELRIKHRYYFKDVRVKDISKANIMISAKDALELKKTDPAAQVLTKCKVIIISGGPVTGKEG